jgi:ribose 1,5-bisphosphate isomerase
MQSRVRRIVRDIKSLKIQGARNVAKSAVGALILEAGASKAKTPGTVLREIRLAGAALAKSRPTEPMMRNAIEDAERFLAQEAKGKADVRVLKKTFCNHENAYLEAMGKDFDRLTGYGAGLIPDNAVVLTHCHSSTVTGILKRAKAKGKRFTVIACETRPRWQGRMTATELARAGINVTLVVDGAANMMMKKADLCLVGADSVTSKGDLINKVGTSMIAHLAKMHDVSFFSAAELSKFSRFTMYGEREKIEERDSREVWDAPARGVRVRNPAFDVTASSYIAGYVTETGVIPAQSFFNVAAQKLGIRI